MNVDTETGVSGMVMPGDEVDLIVSLTGAGRVENVHPDGARLEETAWMNRRKRWCREGPV